MKKIIGHKWKIIMGKIHEVGGKENLTHERKFWK